MQPHPSPDGRRRSDVRPDDRQEKGGARGRSLPRPVTPSVVAGWFLVFMPSFYELTMSIILYGSQTKTIGVLLYELQTYADPQDASVLAVIILLIVLVGNLALRKVSRGQIGI